MTDGAGFGLDGASRFERLLEDTRRTLESVRSGSAGSDGTGDRGGQADQRPGRDPRDRRDGHRADGGAPALAGSGEAAGGQVRATVAGGGGGAGRGTARLESLRVDPQLLRRGCEAMCEQVVLAVNAAFADLESKADLEGKSDVTGSVDPEVLATRLRALQDESMQSMVKFSEALSDVVTRINQAGR